VISLLNNTEKVDEILDEVFDAGKRSK